MAVVRSAFSAHRVNVLPDVSGRVAKIFPKVCTISQIPQPTLPPTPPLTTLLFEIIRFIFLSYCKDQLFLRRSIFSDTHVRIASYAVVLKGSSRVPGAGTRDEPLRTSAWEANMRTVRTSSYAAG